MFTFRAPRGLTSRRRFDSWLCTPHWIDSRCPVAYHSVQFSEFPQVADCCRLQDCLTRRSVEEVVSGNTRWQTGEPADAVSTLKGKALWSVFGVLQVPFSLRTPAATLIVPQWVIATLESDTLSPIVITAASVLLSTPLYFFLLFFFPTWMRVLSLAMQCRWWTLSIIQT